MHGALLGGSCGAQGMLRALCQGALCCLGHPFCPFGAEVLGTSPRWELWEQVPGAVPAAELAAQPGPDVSQMLLTSCLASPHLAFYVLVCFGLQTK